jgi:hypothetical protein
MAVSFLNSGAASAAPGGPEREGQNNGGGRFPVCHVLFPFLPSEVTEGLSHRPRRRRRRHLGFAGVAIHPRDKRMFLSRQAIR